MPPKITGKLTGKTRLPLGRPIPCAIAAGASFALLAGCSRAPTFNILGSYFPAWIVCGVIGILLTVAVRLFFVRINLEDQLVAPLIVVYPCLTALFTFTLWLLFFS
jgi:hypothetical protein